MPLTHSLLKTLKRDYPDIKFELSSSFCWSNSDRTIKYQATAAEDWPIIFHELAHADLKHDSYSHGLDLITMERDAWSHAKNLAEKYSVDISETIIEESLDTYREWLHSRSKCPNCYATGIETSNMNYECISCQKRWKVNDGRSCRLRRDSIKTK